MFLINAKVMDSDFCLKKADIEINDGRIVGFADKLPYKESDLVVDCEGYTIVPGFVDVHVHGGVGADACDADAEGLRNMAKFLLTKGVTAFCPTTMTVSNEDIEKSLAIVRECMQDEGSNIVGVNLEGPFISAKRKGAQGDEFIQAPSFEVFKKFFDGCGGIIKLVDIAPECDEEGFIEKASKLCTVSIAHTDTNYAGAKA
ncbi:MAG: amidohydrolase family protein, partial [Clostridia bacterium]|nr:amidohydrolase family protein [Clostridia bacterium]